MAGWLKWSLGGGVAAAMGAITFLQGPAAVEDFHNRMCGWSSTQRVAGWLGDCKPPEEKQRTTIVITSPEATKDPLETITRRGYQPDHKSLLRAVKLKRSEDVELLIRAGVKPTQEAWHEALQSNSSEILDALIRNGARVGHSAVGKVSMTLELWNTLLKRGAIEEDVPCKFDLSVHKHEGNALAPYLHVNLLTGALERKNYAVYASLCDGKYYSSVMAAAKAFEAEQAKTDGSWAALSAGLSQVRTQCVNRLSSLFTEDTVRALAICSSRSSSCDKSVQDRVKSSVASLRKENLSKGYVISGEPSADLRKSVTMGAACNFGSGELPDYDCLPNKLYEMYGFHVLASRNPDAARYKKMQVDTIARACGFFNVPPSAPNPKSESQFSARRFFEAFRIMREAVSALR